jgi:hypothetical protein
MDLQYLRGIGLAMPNLACLLNPAPCGGPSQHVQSDCSAFDHYFPKAEASQSFIQKLYRLPGTPPHIGNVAELLSWLDETQHKYPEMAGVQGGPAIDLPAFTHAMHRCAGDLESLDAELRNAQTRIRDCIVCSDLCQGLMIANGLWGISNLDNNGIFEQPQVPMPQPICGSGRFGKLGWVKEFDRKVFLSVDMREANFSALRIMARLVDPCLSRKLSTNWKSCLDSLLGSSTEIIGDLKPLREVVLGGLERAWFRRQPDLQTLEGVDPSIKNLSGFEFLQCAFGDEPQAYPPDLQASCSKVFKQMRGRISSAYTAVEHAMIERVAQTLLKLHGARFFCRNADEVMFLLDAQSPGEAEQVVIAASQLLRSTFTEEYFDLGGMFRLEAFLACDMGLRCAAGGASPSMAKLTRRLLPQGGFDAFVALKGVQHEFSLHNLARISESMTVLSETLASEWSTWL